MYCVPPDELSFNGYLDYIRKLPTTDEPEVFGMHKNADFTFRNNEIQRFFNTIIVIQPHTVNTFESQDAAIIERVEGKN